jgi:hypothetical protein
MDQRRSTAPTDRDLLLEPYRNRPYQAIVVDDSTMVHEEELAKFVSNKYRTQQTSVVVMAVEGLFNLRLYREMFGVDWRFVAYTKRTVQLTDLGRQIITADAFLPDNLYVKACFVEAASSGPEPTTSGALFVEHVDPRDYGDEYSSDEDDAQMSGVRPAPVPPPPSPGSPVVCSIQGGKSASYFGFVNSLDVSYGAIVLTVRLCYAAQHAAAGIAHRTEAARIDSRQSRETRGNRNRNERAEVMTTLNRACINTFTQVEVLFESTVKQLQCTHCQAADLIRSDFCLSYY